MSANLVIIQLLHTQSNHSDFLRLCWENLTVEQKREIFYFLYLSEQYKTFLTILRTELSNDNPFVPWTHLYAILDKYKKLSPSVVKAFIHAPPKEEQGVFRLRSQDLKDIWSHKKNEVLKAHTERKAALLQTLSFAKQQGMKDQRNKALSELKSLFPKDRDIEFAIHEEKEFQARNTLNKISSRQQQAAMVPNKPEKNDPQMIKQLAKDAIKVIKEKPDLCLDMAILFFQMELYDEALKMIDSAKKKSTTLLWYELYISIEAQQYARALSAVEWLKGKKDISSEQSFSLMYFQALALHGLGQMAEARRIVKHIVKIRPHFKSASSLLLEWESDK